MNRPTGNISLEASSPVRIDWHVPEYFTVPEEDSRIFISPNFVFMHTGWRLALVVSGRNASAHAGWIGLKLLWDGSTATTRYYRISFSIGINRHDGTEFRNWRGVGAASSRDWGCDELVRRSDLNEADGVIAPDGLVRTFCVLTAEKIETADKDAAKGQHEGSKAKEENSEKKDVTPKVTGVQKLLQDFKDLMLSGDDSDMTLRVQGREFKSHRTVLAARSPVFAAMLRHDMTEKNSGVVQVEDCDPVAFECFLEHLYTGKVQKLSDKSVFELYRIADKYDTGDLKVKCIDFIQGCQSIETFCDLVTLATEYDESELLERAITFFSQNMRQIIATDKWQGFLKDYTEIGNKLLLEALDLTSKNTKC